MNANKYGFTLIELLVAVGIISIIIALGTVSYTNTQKKARDSKRTSDLNAIQTAMEQYYLTCGYSYPMPTDGVINNIICTTPPPSVILPTMPVDPLNATPYLCQGACDGSEYIICPPNVRETGGTPYLMETQDCTVSNSTCCIVNKQ